jgi:hypothetical protein
VGTAEGEIDDEKANIFSPPGSREIHLSRGLDAEQKSSLYHGRKRKENKKVVNGEFTKFYGVI